MLQLIVMRYRGGTLAAEAGAPPAGMAMITRSPPPMTMIGPAGRPTPPGSAAFDFPNPNEYAKRAVMLWVAGLRPVLRSTPAGRSLSTRSPFVSVPVVMLYGLPALKFTDMFAEKLRSCELLIDRLAYLFR